MLALSRTRSDVVVDNHFLTGAALSIPLGFARSLEACGIPASTRNPLQLIQSVPSLIR